MEEEIQVSAVQTDNGNEPKPESLPVVPVKDDVEKIKAGKAFLDPIASTKGTERRLFVEWYELTVKERRRLGLPETQAEFAKTIGVNPARLSIWKGLPEFQEEMRRRARGRVIGRLPGVLEALCDKAETGDVESVDRVLEIAELKQPKGAQVQVAVNQGFSIETIVAEESAKFAPPKWARPIQGSASQAGNGAASADGNQGDNPDADIIDVFVEVPGVESGAQENGSDVSGNRADQGNGAIRPEVDSRQDTPGDSVPDSGGGAVSGSGPSPSTGNSSGASSGPKDSVSGDSGPDNSDIEGL